MYIGAESAQEVHERGTRDAREGQERFMRGAQEVHDRDKSGAREGHERCIAKPSYDPKFA